MRMRALPHENKMSNLLAADSEEFNLFLEFLIHRKDEIRDMMPLGSTESFDKNKHIWLFLDELTRDNGNDLRTRMRAFWQENAPKSLKSPFKES
jgi:hypothetical protein